MNGTDAYLGMAIGRPTKPLNVTSAEKEKLSMLARAPRSLRRRWRCAPALSLSAVKDSAMARLRIVYESRGQPCASGESDLGWTDWKVCSTNHGRARRGP